MTDASLPWLYSVEAVCKDCGTTHQVHTLRPPEPGQGPINRRCDPCVEKVFNRPLQHPRPSTKPATPVDGEAPLAPPRKVFGYDD